MTRVLTKREAAALLEWMDALPGNLIPTPVPHALLDANHTLYLIAGRPYPPALAYLCAKIGDKQ